MVSRERVVKAVHAVAPRGSRARLLLFLESLPAEELAQSCVTDADDDELIYDYIALKAQGKRASGAAEQGTGDGGSVATAAATGALAGTGASATVAAGGTAGGSLPALTEAMKAALTEMGVLSALMQMQGVLPPLMQTVSMIAQLQLTRFDYTSIKASSSRQGDDFKDRLQAFYDNNMDAPALHATPRQHLRCMLLNVKLPKTLVTAVHLFKHCWKADFRVVLGLTDINDARNGLLLFKPLEHAFDDSRICFTSVEEAGEIQFKMKLLDSKLEEIKVWDYAAEHNLCKGYSASQIDDYAATVTFGELQNKPLVFTNNNRPYKRCLRFQGLQAVRRADASNWLPKGGSPPQDMFSNSEEAKRLDVWLTMAAQAPPPPDADESSNAGEASAAARGQSSVRKFMPDIHDWFMENWRDEEKRGKWEAVVAALPQLKDANVDSIRAGYGRWKREQEKEEKKEEQ